MGGCGAAHGAMDLRSGNRRRVHPRLWAVRRGDQRL